MVEEIIGRLPNLTETQLGRLEDNGIIVPSPAQS